MKVEPQVELNRKSPRSFRDPPELSESRHALGRYGVECGDGWLELIDGAAPMAERHIAELIAKDDDQANWPPANAITEKFGTLKIAIPTDPAGMPPSLREAVRAAKEVAKRPFS